MALTPSRPITQVIALAHAWVLTGLVIKLLIIDMALPTQFISGPEPLLPMKARLLGSVKGVLAGIAELDRTDELLIQFTLAPLAGYLLMGFLCLAMDLLLPVKVRIAMKTQGEGSRPFSFREWTDAFSLSMRNMFIVAPPAAWALFYLPLRGGESWSNVIRQKWYIGPDGLRLPGFDQWDWQAELLNFVVHLITVETIFYWTHRLFHYGKFYRMIHKKHHRFTAPVSVASMYAHWVEFLLNNLAGIILGPFFTNCHPYHTLFWLCFSLVNTGGAHSGYYCFAGLKHDLHHELFNCNFGVLKIFDTICKTREVDIHAKKMAARRSAVTQADIPAGARHVEAAAKRDQ